MPTLRVALLSLSLLVLAGCDLFQVGPRDVDGDGWDEELDCDDTDPGIYPEAGEACDGADNDCDGAIDEGYDADGDGWTPCSEPSDCNDDDATIFPGAEELCDGIDSNCNGDDDEGTGCDPDEDADGDGYSADEDCDDSDPWTYPGAGELCDGSDNDCDGSIDEDFDEDGDGYSSCDDLDCNDGNAGVYPGAAELCNGQDDDCDGAIDEDFDADLDGSSTCEDPADCDDNDPTTYPGAPELCDQTDNDCDGGVDEDTVDDNDGDGVSACEGDCNDGNAGVYPGAVEIPNGIDDDCSGAADDGYSGILNADLFDPVGAGSQPQQLLGERLSSGGGFNADPYSDFVSGSPTAGGGAGRVDLFLGSSYSVTNPPAAISPFASIVGGAGDALGDGLDLGDVNGDGYADILIGAPGSTLSQDPPAGDVYIFFGGPVHSSGNWPLAAADVRFSGENPSTERCGVSVAAVGDVNGDGIGDLAFSCPWHQVTAGSPAGRTAIFFGRLNWSSSYSVDDADSLILGSLDDEYSGDAITGGFDINGDGYDDFAVGSSGYASGTGRIGISFGRATASWPSNRAFGDLDRVYYANLSFAQGVGAYLASGDANGDAYDDLLVGAPAMGSDKGAIGLVLGSASMPSSGYFWNITQMYVLGNAVTERTGNSGVLQDIDADGYGDLVIGSPGYDGSSGADQGQISIFYGPLTNYSGSNNIWLADAHIQGESQGDYFGATSTWVEDFGGGGTLDLVVGAPYAGSSDNGEVRVIPAF